jgi:ABC-2 type transport system permease protein
MAERRPDWLPVARWELYRILRRKDFVISILATPLLMFLVSFLMVAFVPKGPRKVAVARVEAGDTVIFRGNAALPAAVGYQWLDPGTAGADTAALAAAVRAGAFDAALVIHSETDGRWILDLVTRREPPRWTRELREHVQAEARNQRALHLGLTPAQIRSLDDSVTVRSHTASGRRSGSWRGDFLVTFAILILMLMVLMTGMSYLMVGISGEKQARVTEVIVSAVPAQAWMDGKLVAFTLVSLLGGVVWALSLVVLAIPFAFQIPGSVNLLTMTLTVVFAVLGIYLYNAMMAALMASAQSMQSAAKWQSNFFTLPFIPFFFLGPLMDNPDSTAMVLLSLIPFFAPVMIPVRLVQGAVQWWEPIAAAVLLVVSCWAMRRAAGRVFRLGMLMYGKDMTLPELLRWARVK